MKNARVYAVLFYLLVVLAMSACGGSEGVVSSSSPKNEDANRINQEIPDDGNGEMPHSDAPVGTGGTGGGGN